MGDDPTHCRGARQGRQCLCGRARRHRGCGLQGWQQGEPGQHDRDPWSHRQLHGDIERAIDDGVNVFKGVCKDGRLTAGGGSTEIELARQVSAWGETHAGLEQYSINKFAEALEVVPRVLAENSGVKPKEVIAKLYAAHSEGKTNMGFDIEGDTGDIKDCLESEVFDLLIAKKWALKYAVNAACTILRVDQIIMAKRAGGPKPRDTSGGMDQDDD